MTKTYIGILIILLLASFSLGRYSVQKPEIKETIKTDETKKENIVTETHTETTKQPDGTTKVVTDTTEHEVIQDHTTDVTKVDVVPVKTGRLNVSLIGSLDTTKGLQTPDYGLSVSKEVLGPVTAGLFYMRSGILGVSIGLDF